MQFWPVLTGYDVAYVLLAQKLAQRPLAAVQQIRIARGAVLFFWPWICAALTLQTRFDSPKAHLCGRRVRRVLGHFRAKSVSFVGGMCLGTLPGMVELKDRNLRYPRQKHRLLGWTCREPLRDFVCRHGRGFARDHAHTGLRLQSRH